MRTRQNVEIEQEPIVTSVDRYSGEFLTTMLAEWFRPVIRANLDIQGVLCERPPASHDTNPSTRRTAKDR